MVKIYNEDCLERLDKLEEKSIDLILCDLPYGVTQAKHDKKIQLNDYIEVKIRNKVVPLTEEEYYLHCFKKGKSYGDVKKEYKENFKEGLWTKYHRVIKDNGAIILFGQDKFTNEIMNSNLKEHRYNLIWEKLGQPTGFLNANKMPMRSHEDILIFYKKLPTYNPQKVVGNPTHSRGKEKEQTNKNYNNYEFRDNHKKHGNMKHPRSIISFNKPHPPIFATQKSIELCEWLIKSYTNEGDTVLDNCMGSGTTGIACLNTKRNFIGIENNLDNFNLAKERIEEVENEK